MSNDIRTGYEQAAKALAERAKGWGEKGNYTRRDECLQCASMLHDLKPAVAPVASAAPSGKREKFEASVLKRNVSYDNPEFLLERNSTGEYVVVRIQGEWIGWQAAIAHQPPKEALSLEKLNEMAAKHIKDISGYERPIKPMGEDHEFIVMCRAIEAASAPNKQLVAALKEACVLILLEVADGMHTEEYRRARAALAAAGESTS